MKTGFDSYRYSKTRDVEVMNTLYFIKCYTKSLKKLFCALDISWDPLIYPNINWSKKGGIPFQNQDLKGIVISKMVNWNHF